jgi:hypothetical protein
MSFSLMPDARSKIYMLSCAMIMAPPWTAQAALDAELAAFRGYDALPGTSQHSRWVCGTVSACGSIPMTGSLCTQPLALQVRKTWWIWFPLWWPFIIYPDQTCISAVGQLSTRLFFDRMIYMFEIYTLSCAMTMAPPWTAQAALDADLVPVKLRRFAESVAHFQKGVWSFMWMKFNTNDIETLYCGLWPSK